jgi:hypothetical protein
MTAASHDTVTTWLRREMGATIGRRAVVCGLITGAAVAGVTWLRDGAPSPLAAVVAAVVAAGLALALVPAAATSRRRSFLRYIQSPPVFVVNESADAGATEVAGVIDDFRQIGFQRLAQLDAEGTDTRVDLLGDGAVTVAAVYAPSALVMLITSLGHDAALVTTPLLAVPRDGVVANVVGSSDAAAMMESHAQLVGEVFARQAVRADPAALFLSVHANEVAAVGELTPAWAGMLDLRCRPWSPRLGVGPSAMRILWRTGSRFLDDRVTTTSSGGGTTRR